MKRKIILAGGSGFLGGALAWTFTARGCEVIVLTRSPREHSDGAKEVFWNAKSLGDWVKFVDGAEVVINLMGKSMNVTPTTAEALAANTRARFSY